MFRNLLSYHRAFSLPPLNFASPRRQGTIYFFSFTLPYKYVWTLSYTYRVLISPIDKLLEQRNDKTKQNTKISMCEQWLRHGVLVWSETPLSATPRRGHACLGMGLRCGVGSLCHGVGPPTLPRFFSFHQFFQKSNQKPQILQKYHQKQLPNGL